MKPGTIYFASREKKKEKSSEARYYLFCIEGKISISVLLFDENTECIDGWMDGWMDESLWKKERKVQIQKWIRPNQSFICF